MELYANYLILMSININENMRNYRKMEKEVGVYLENWYQTDAKIQTFYLLIRYANYLIIKFMNINETLEMRENRGNH